MNSTRRAACAAAAISGVFAGAIAPVANAGSITANTGTYAGDIGALNFPVGSVAVSDYLAYRKGGTFYDTAGVADRSGKLDVVTNIVRVDWIATKLGDMPLALSAALPYGHVGDARLSGADASTQSSFFSPNVFVTLGLITQPENERTLAVSGYLFLPVGDYDSAKSINVATPDQTVFAPQFALEEGLGKFSPALQNMRLDLFGGAAFHSDGDNPLTSGGAGFDRTEQDHSYNLNLYLRYNWDPLTFLAAGIERSWGGAQFGVGGALGAGGDVALTEDDYTKGHLQFGIPLSPTMQLAADITHDFQREGGFREDFTVEIRLSTFFIPAAPAK